MATQTRNPTSDVAVTGTLSGVAGSRWQLVDDYPDTAGTDTLTFGTTAATIVFGFQAFSIPSAATDISVQVLYYDGEAASGANNCSGRLRVGGVNFNAATHNPAGATYTARSDNFATNPQTAAAWTVDQVNGIGSNALQGFGIHSTDSSPTFRVSSVQLQVTYTEASSAGSGSATASVATSAGTGSIETSGSGSATGGAATSVGSGTVEEISGDITGSGSSTASTAISTGSGSVGVAASGSSSAAALTASATGNVTVGASGSAAPLASTSTGSGTSSIALTGSSSATGATTIGSGYVGIEQPPPTNNTGNNDTRRRQMRAHRRR